MRRGTRGTTSTTSTEFRYSFFLSYLVCGCVQSGRYGDLVLCARRNVEGSLANDRHVQVMYNRHLESLAPLVVVPIVVRFDVKQHTVRVHADVTTRFCSIINRDDSFTRFRRLL